MQIKVNFNNFHLMLFKVTYEIPDINAKLNKDEMYRHKLMFMCVVFNEYNYVKYFLKHKTSPFLNCVNKRNCVHAACYYGRIKILKLIWESDYSIIKGKKKPVILSPEKKLRWMNY